MLLRSTGSSSSSSTPKKVRRYYTFGEVSQMYDVTRRRRMDTIFYEDLGDKTEKERER